METLQTPARPTRVTAEVAALVRRRFGTPCYVYDHVALEAAARQALAFPAPFGLTVRYAMKANPSRGILTLFRDLGLHVDASSDFEVERALKAGFAPERIQLTSQAPSRALEEHLARGVLFNACSLHQLEEFGRIAPGRDLSVRVNPGLGTGSTKRTNTGGPASSFGIWHEAMGEIAALAKRLTDRRITLDVGEDAMEWLALTGYDPVYGARPLRRLVQSAIGDELARGLLSGSIRDGDTVHVALSEAKDTLEVTSA